MIRNRLTNIFPVVKFKYEQRQGIFYLLPKTRASIRHERKENSRLLLIADRSPLFLYDLMKLYIPPAVFEISRDLTLAQFKLYIYLAYQWKMNKSKPIIKTDEQLSREISISHYSIFYAIRKLAEKKLISYIRGKYESHPTIYTLLEGTIDNFKSSRKSTPRVVENLHSSRLKSSRKSTNYKDKINKEENSYFLLQPNNWKEETLKTMGIRKL